MECDLPAEFAVVLTVGGVTGTFTQTGLGAYRYQDVRGSHEFRFGGDVRFGYRVQNADGSSAEFSL
jgi:hypothetical protein